MTRGIVAAAKPFFDIHVVTRTAFSEKLVAFKSTRRRLDIIDMVGGEWSGSRTAKMPNEHSNESARGCN